MSDSGGLRLFELRAFYRAGEEVVLSALPPRTARAVARRATGKVFEAELGAVARFAALPPGTYSVEALAADDEVLAEELTTVGAHAGDRPVHGFASSFAPASVPVTLEWLRELRCTVVQVYDWMRSYSAPLGPQVGWRDPSNREVSFEALRALAAGIRAQGAVAHAYAPIYAVDPPFAAEHPEWLMYRGDGAPERLFDNILLADPANPLWQRHFTNAYGGAADAIGFNGFHIDTYGFPRAARDAPGRPVDMRSAYASFLTAFRGARPSDLVSFNQVNGVPSAMELPDGPGFRYCEVWPPNEKWRHLEGLLDRSSGTAGRLGAVAAGSPLVRGSIACYPPVWAVKGPGGSVPDRAGSLRTVVLTEAIATSLGASALLYGDMNAVLCDAYYPRHERLSDDEKATVVKWHRFALRCRDLFLEGEDTSWYEIADENGAVAVQWDGPASPEPVGGALFARVSRTSECVAVAVVDLTGSHNGSWAEPSQPGSCRSVVARVLLDDPARWGAAVAVLGRDHDRFVPVPLKLVGHREGLAAEIAVPVDAGWSVLRLTR